MVRNLTPTVTPIGVVLSSAEVMTGGDLFSSSDFHPFSGRGTGRVDGADAHLHNL